MAGRWSTENFVAELKDVQASAMAVDCLGNWALLAGRKNLTFVDLSKPLQTVVKVTRQSKWDIGCVHWNHHASHAHRFVTACNQRLDVFDFQDASASHLCSMKAHSRTVSDVDWSPFDVNVIASCSVDTFTYFWDVRDYKKPVKSFQTVSGVYQVKWNKVTNNLFATTHDGDVRIWDPRNGNTPVQYISAHPSKIHGLDWSTKDQYKFVTASQDCTIRFWDYNTPRRSEAIINSGNPVWRARYTPFGNAVTSVVVPQLRRGENSLYLWQPDSPQVPVHTFVGHKDVILEFQWRKQPDGARDHQLVTWSKDQTLRIWKVDTAMQKSCGEDVGDHSLDDLLDEDSLNPLSTIIPGIDTLNISLSRENFKNALSDSGSGSTMLIPESQVSSSPTSTFDPSALEQEVDSMARIPGLKVDKSKLSRRQVSFKLMRGMSFLEMDVTVPAGYPIECSPTLAILNTNLDKDMQTRLVKGFQDVCSIHLKQRMICLEAGIRQMLMFLEKASSTSLETQAFEERKPEKKFHVEKVKSPSSPIGGGSTSPMYPTGSFQDSSVPFPRTSGARFCSNDRLVMFCVPSVMRKVQEETEVTPRALSDLVAYTQSHHSQWNRSLSSSVFSMSMFYGSPPASMQEGISISSFYTEKSKPKQRPAHHHHHHHHHKHVSRSKEGMDLSRRGDREADKQSKRLQKVANILIYDISAINPVSRFLAENYKLDLSDIPGTCEHNAAVALRMGRKDIVQLWQLISQMSHPSLQPSPNVDQGSPWAYHPFGRALVQKFLNHYLRVRDVQTAALICCIFWDKEHQLNDAALMDPSPNQDSRASLEYAVTNYNPYHTVSSVTNLLKGWTSTSTKPECWSPTPSSPHPPAIPSPINPLQAMAPPPSVKHSPLASAAEKTKSRALAEVASQPNVAALFRAGRGKGVKHFGGAMMKSKRSLSWSESFDDFKMLEDKHPREREVDRERLQHHNNSKMLDPEKKNYHEQIKQSYANLLYKWQLLNQRSQVLKYTDNVGNEPKPIGFSVSCYNCKEDVREVQCHRCKYPALQCAICHVGVRGAANVCLACGHGGHTLHMMDWFHTETVCPTGCGCNCLQENCVPDAPLELH